MYILGCFPLDSQSIKDFIQQSFSPIRQSKDEKVNIKPGRQTRDYLADIKAESGADEVRELKSLVFRAHVR